MKPTFCLERPPKKAIMLHQLLVVAYSSLMYKFIDFLVPLFILSYLSLALLLILYMIDNNIWIDGLLLFWSLLQIQILFIFTISTYR